MPVSLEGQEQIREYLNGCLGSMVTVCAPAALRGSEIYKSTSRVIIAGFHCKFRSAEVHFKNTGAESNADRLGEGNLVAHVPKTFVISSFWKAPDVDEFVDVDEGASVYSPDIGDKEYKALYAKACQICNKSVEMMKKRFFHSPDPRREKTLARKALKKLPELQTSLCVLFTMLVDIGELNSNLRVDGYQSPDSDEDDSESTDGDDEDDGDGDDAEDDNGVDVTQYPDDEDDEQADGDVQDQTMAEAGVETAAAEAPKPKRRSKKTVVKPCFICRTTQATEWKAIYLEKTDETRLLCVDCFEAAESEGETGPVVQFVGSSN